jgi:hypothetical protein
VADTGAVVDVVGLETDPCKFLQCVAVLVHGTARGLESQGFGAVLVRDLLKFFCNQVDSLVPGRVDELTVLFDLRRCEPVGAVNMFPAGHSLRTELALVNRASLVGFNPYHFSLVDHEVEPTTNTAIRAGCWYIF